MVDIKSLIDNRNEIIGNENGKTRMLFRFSYVSKGRQYFTE